MPTGHPVGKSHISTFPSSCPSEQAFLSTGIAVSLPGGPRASSPGCSKSTQIYHLTVRKVGVHSGSHWAQRRCQQGRLLPVPQGRTVPLLPASRGCRQSLLQPCPLCAEPAQAESFSLPLSSFLSWAPSSTRVHPCDDLAPPPPVIQDNLPISGQLTSSPNFLCKQ